MANFSTAKTETDRAKQEAIRDSRICKELITKEGLNEEDLAYLRRINDRNLTLEEIDTEIDVIQGRLSLLHEGNPNAIREFERRAKEIEALQMTIQEQQAKLEEIA